MTDVSRPPILVSTKYAKICTDSNLGLTVRHIWGSKCKLWYWETRKRPSWMELWVTWSSGRFPAYDKGGGTGCFLGPFLSKLFYVLLEEFKNHKSYLKIDLTYFKCVVLKICTTVRPLLYSLQVHITDKGAFAGSSAVRETCFYFLTRKMSILCSWFQELELQKEDRTLNVKLKLGANSCTLIRSSHTVRTGIIKISKSIVH